MNKIANKGQKIHLSGVGAHHHNGGAESFIKKLSKIFLYGPTCRPVLA